MAIDSLSPTLLRLPGSPGPKTSWSGIPVRDCQSLDEAVALAEGGQPLMVCIDGPGARALLELLDARPARSAMTLLIPGASELDHPHLRLLRALAEGKRAWETAFDAIPDALMVLDRSGCVRQANRALAELLGRPVTAIPGLSYTSALGPAQGGQDPVARALERAEPVLAEARFGALPGPCLVTVAPISGAVGGSDGAVVLLKDLSRLRREEGLLRLAVRMADVGQLAAGVAHEINTPLASIALRAESLLRQADDPRLREQEAFRNFPRYLRTMLEETFRCKRIIGALLEFSAARSPSVGPVGLNSLVQSAADLVGHQMQLKGVDLELRLHEPLETLEADEGQLRQVLLALMMNALDAAAEVPGGGHVRVETRSAEGGVELCVGDDGAGMTAEVRAQALTPFFTTKPPGQGTGLGLAVCHGIVTAHGGRIWIESEPGQGTRVRVALPLSARRAEAR